MEMGQFIINKSRPFIKMVNGSEIRVVGDDRSDRSGKQPEGFNKDFVKWHYRFVKYDGKGNAVYLMEDAEDCPKEFTYNDFENGLKEIWNL